MFIGVDHGTNAMRFAGIGKDGVNTFELPRSEVANMSGQEILDSVTSGLGVHISDIELAAVTYSMGDGIVAIEDLKDVSSRGVISIEGVGKKTGAGTRVFDAIRESVIPAVLIPGIHSKSNTDSRMNVFSHSTSPEKIGIAYNAYSTGVDDFVVSDISSNTVTVGVCGGKLIGAIDACIFAPGTQHGPLDLEAIRDVDAGKCSANDAFMNAGVLNRSPYSGVEDLLNALNGNEDEAVLAMDRISLFAAMEIAAMQVLMEDYGSRGEIFLAGSMGEEDYVVDRIGKHIGVNPDVLGKWSASIGCAEIARDIAGGADSILGLDVHFSF
ncbi:methanogenesis marker 12 protein [Methanococcoides sp. AM1]|uniref:methanogenesis marker 12 protein n=1 Tax=Methanococcoides sp. AM1 TaxID=1201011 RepID=UPI001AEFFB9C|nr:methanogenesis marker 12 protein [Methanococcoides sp. AM1]